MDIYKESAQQSKLSGTQIPVTDYHTTLMFVAFKLFSFGYFFISFFIGTGAMLLYNPSKSGKVLPLGTPDSRGCANYAAQKGTEFYFTDSTHISPEKVKIRTFFNFARDFDAILLATDGVTDTFFPTIESLHSEKDWQRFWNESLKKGDARTKGASALFAPDSTLAGKLLGLKNFLSFTSSADQDDRTILLIK
jgi:hypothetical protein